VYACACVRVRACVLACVLVCVCVYVFARARVWVRVRVRVCVRARVSLCVRARARVCVLVGRVRVCVRVVGSAWLPWGPKGVRGHTPGRKQGSATRAAACACRALRARNKHRRIEEVAGAGLTNSTNEPSPPASRVGRCDHRTMAPLQFNRASTMRATSHSGGARPGASRECSLFQQSQGTQAAKPIGGYRLSAVAQTRSLRGVPERQALQTSAQSGGAWPEFRPTRNLGAFAGLGVGPANAWNQARHRECTV
jgi:hypothetical protein